MVSPLEFWTRFLNYRYQEINELRPGMCSKPYDLKLVARELGLNYKGLKAPSIVSITNPARLPSILKQQRLYVIRLGQRRTGYANFIICRASENYYEEAIWFNELLGVSGKEYVINKSEWNTLKMISGEALASTITVSVLNKLVGVKYIVPQYRGGNVEFNFKVTCGSRSYKYSGQVEVDTIIFTRNNRIYAVESKNTNIVYEGVFKHQLVFSMASLSRILKREIDGILAIRYPRLDTVKIVFLKPSIKPYEEPIINDLSVEEVFTVKPA